MKRRKTDYGTVILHWLLVAAIGAAFVSGLRIASEAPDRTWINLFDTLLPRASVWTLHMKSAVVLIGIAIAYAVYLLRSGLGSRIRLDKIRLRSLFGRKHARIGAISVFLTWGFFAAMVTLIASGALLYFGLYAGYGAATSHWWATWALPLFVCLHVLVHAMIGGASQLLRILRPGRLPPPPPRLDAVDLLRLLVERSPSTPETDSAAETNPQLVRPNGDDGHDRHPQQRQARQPTSPMAASPNVGRRRDVSLQSNPLLVAAAVAITGLWLAVATDWMTADSLHVHRITAADAPVLDGDTSDAAWRNIQPVSVMTNQGGNFDGKSESRIDIRAVHDGTWAYFLFTWEDPTRSLKQLPLIKRADGWHLLHDGYENGDEHAFNEDKFSVLFTTMNVTLAGDRTFHASPHPIADAPSTKTGRGLHFTPAEGVYADVWQWKATSGGPTGWMDDDHFGPPLEPTPAQLQRLAPYRGGFAHDPGTANYSDNFIVPLDAADQFVKPRRLPKDVAAMTAAMGLISLDPNVGESDGARWFMTEAESVPYTQERDRQIPVGTVVPGVIVSGEFSGDRADIRCAARWASGHWALEVARRLETQSKYDVPIKSGVFMRVSAFDHSQIRHTRHVRPIRVEVE
ncbi:ethylbenzene dehydrogenase-related protein [Bradyrhizobium sp. STM 3562]|uniref:ethylbenzene dehydrogenase-related protein n=1 Tax=Bradyrhizobium sp. STM 3562 TaxID=578924 RepID=UPI00388E8AB8